jgi:hypothetical protein
LAWLWTSDAVKQLTMWFAVGMPLLFPYILSVDTFGAVLVKRDPTLLDVAIDA